VRVLCIDDDPDAADSLVLVLRLFGFDALAAYCGKRALDAAVSFRPHVCLIDYRMPGMSGCELARRLTNHPGFEHPVLIALSAFGSIEVRRDTQAAGFRLHLVKPVDLDALPATLIRLVRGWDDRKPR